MPVSAPNRYHTVNMRSVDPKRHIRFIGDHFDLIDDLYTGGNAYARGDLFALVRQHRSPADPSAEHVEGQLHDLQIVDERPGATASYELQPQLRRYLDYLFTQHRLGTPERIKALLVEVQSLAERLETTGDRISLGRANRYLGKIGDTLEELRAYSRRNREAIVAAIVKLRSADRPLSSRERYGFILELWEEYLQPLRELIDDRKFAARVFDGVERKLNIVQHKVAEDSAIGTHAQSTIDRLARLQRDLMDDLHAAIAEAAPLYEKLRRESLIARGAGQLLSVLDEHADVDALGLTAWFALPVWKFRDLFSDWDLQSLLREVKHHEPAAPPSIKPPTETQQRRLVPWDKVKTHMQEALPLDDAFAWLLENYPALPLTDVLRLYTRLLRDETMTVAFAKKPQTYVSAAYRIQATPLQVTEMTT